jgi:hypothetical protein
MTNEEKAREILSCPKCPFRTDRPHKIDIGEDACAVCFDYESVMAMAKWKDERIKELEITLKCRSKYERIYRNEFLKAGKEALINKACEWLRENASKHIHGPAYMFYGENMIEEFKQAMEDQ